MPEIRLQPQVNSEEVHEIITAVPSWILKWGITLVFAILGSIILLSAFINYPDVVKTSLKINCLNAPKTVLAKQTGKLTALLVSEGHNVKSGQALAYLESTANAKDVLRLNQELKKVQLRISRRQFEAILLPEGLNIGEMQGSYQNFYGQYLQYQATTKNGYYLKRMAFLEKDLRDIKALNSQIVKQQKIQQLEYKNQEEEYGAYKKLYKNKVISRSEFAQQENKYLASKYPLQQSETAILNNSGTYSAKEKELLDLRHTISEEQAKFVQALNQCITESDTWIMQHILFAPVDGKVSFAGIVQQDQNIQAGQEIFIINPGNTDFFGEIQIPQYNMGKIKKGARTLVKMHSYPYEQYGIIKGRLTYISDVAFRDSVFVAKVSFEHFENKDPDRKIVLKNGMQADAEIITEESSLLQRFFRNITKMLNNG
ncbi:HlyD family efflux transporter periplasmic adaptor subunit [Pedobacter alluvionis]|uniref:HlyD family efflux transporter periplasmic adaptor subunit n=1 Tax=Pedobacter alluvionis TaxID=475253 RepID=A0A497XYE9_9SPHI|nr:HlyD family efflux transporter periplasmic adaptor subunit [Pedobacter alluvionis]RLJ75151.1 HlyD family secretion protein [Pedobacter alluvionis]TFB30254.1 HlyD family efflux transporter periplasmic adaptor subunit [Pedobacter alluvionis]